ncbi:hypothetical protein D3C83_312440 [compost metagenome]
MLLSDSSIDRVVVAPVARVCSARLRIARENGSVTSKLTGIASSGSQAIADASG